MQGFKAYKASGCLKLQVQGFSEPLGWQALVFWTLAPGKYPLLPDTGMGVSEN